MKNNYLKTFFGLDAYQMKRFTFPKIKITSALNKKAEKTTNNFFSLSSKQDAKMLNIIITYFNLQ